MEWHSIEGYPGLLINRSGDVIGKRGKILRPSNPKGYALISTYVGSKLVTAYIHRLLAITFIQNPDPVNKTNVNHIDGNKNNNCLSNLEWVTPKENVAHAIALGLRKSKYGDAK